MLKLKNSNGKFDIVFESAPVLDDDAKRSGQKATSAKRRKNREWKSSILPKNLPKEPNYTKVKTSKATQLRDETVAKKYDTDKKTKKPIKGPSRKKIKNKENFKDPPSTTESKKDRRDTFTYSADDAGVITEKELDEINERLKRKDTVKPTIPVSKHSPNTTLDPSRENEIRRRQATPVQIYDPWGKPGAGAPMSSVDGSIRTHRNVRLLQQEKDTKSVGGKMNHEVPSLDISPDSPRDFKNESTSKSPATSTRTAQTGAVNRFARGKGKAEHELDEIEKSRLKQLEHQKAIAAQVEEKRLQKQLEKERKRKEEEEAEARYQQQQELIQQRLEEEQRKEREKQEAKMLKQKMLEESIRKAQEEALKAKEEARKAKWANAETSKSPSNSPRYRRVLHNENDAIRPSQNFDESGFVSPKENDLTETASSQDESPRSHRDKPKKLQSRIPQPMGRNRPVNKIEEEQLTNQVSEDQPINNVKGDMYSKLMEESHLDDYLVPFHRTKTADMYEDYSDESEEELENEEEELENEEEEDDEDEEEEEEEEDDEAEEEEEEEEEEKEFEQSVNKKKELEKLRKKTVNEENRISKSEKRKTTKTLEATPANDDKDNKVVSLKPKKNTEKPLHNKSDEKNAREAANVTKKKDKSSRKPKEHTPRARTLSVENEYNGAYDYLNMRKSVKKPSTTPQVNKRRTSPPMHIQESSDAPLTPSTKRQQEILNRLAELRQGLQQKERECYNTTWSR